jgi:hypothetical protein
VSDADEMSFHGSIPGLGTDVVPHRRGSSGSQSPQRSGHHWPYRAVHVLLVYWKDGTKDFYDQLRELGKEFKGSYKYQVEEWAIESEGPYKKLNERLLKFLEYDQDGALLIVYYGGHGGINKDKNHTWLW